MAFDLLTLLRSRGRLTAGDVTQALGVSRATLMRRVRALGGAVVVRGQARRTTYAARRELRGSQAPLPVYRVDPKGDVQEVARLDLTWPDGCAATFLADLPWPLDATMRDGWFDGLPYPLRDMRPQGFLGRTFALRHAGMLQVPADPTRWSDDHALHAMSLLGVDLPGDLIVGAEACRLWLERVQDVRLGRAEQPIRTGEVADTYPRLAEAALADEFAGSSAGGEFPKFLTTRAFDDGRVQPVLVKFSGADTSPGSERWADLLVCEHLAGEVLPPHLGVPAATSRLYRAGGRTFLEVERFDRHGSLGRSGVVSWSSVDGALFGLADPAWPEAARHLLARGWLDTADAARIERLWRFGQLIANTDMHGGNLSFEPSRAGYQATLRPAPAYDMLPMLYAPSRGMDVPVRTWLPRLPLPAERETWFPAARAAIAFWQRCADDARISAAFRAVCAGHAGTLLDLVRRSSPDA